MPGSSLSLKIRAGIPLNSFGIRNWNFNPFLKTRLDTILVLDDEGICQNANPSADIFFSSDRKTLIGQTVRSFYAETADFDSMWSRLQAERRYQGETELVRSDGVAVYAEFTATAHFLPSRHLMILRDITSRRRAQQALNQSLMVARSSWQEAETLRKASIALTEDLRMNSVLDALLQTLSDFVPYERAQLFLLETDTRLFLAHEATQGPKPLPDSGLPETFEVVDLPIIQTALASREGILIDDMSEEMKWSSAGREVPVRSWIGVPIVSSDQVLGLLSLSDSNPAHFSAHHLALTRSLATPAAVAIQNARLYERAEIYGAELERRVAEMQQIDLELQASGDGNRGSVGRFENIFHTLPIAVSVSSLVTGRFLETNEAFERGFGFVREEITSGMATELELWESPRERTKTVERLGRGARVRSAVARFRRGPGVYKETMYSAEIVELEGRPCLLIAAEDQIESNVNS